MTDLSKLAAGLTEAQRRAVLRLDRNWRFVRLADRPEGMPSLTERWNKPYGGFNYRLTPLGEALRNHIRAGD